MWFCLLNDDEYGPFSQEEAERFVTENPETYVWQEGLTEWIPASRFKSLFSRTTDFSLPSSSFDSSLNFEIVGDDMQYAEITLNPNEEMLAEPGSMIYKQAGVELQAVLGTRKKNLFSRFFSAGKRMMTGENFFLTSFINRTNRPQKVAFSAPYCGKIIPVSLSTFGNGIICQKDSFLCAQSDVEVGIFFQKKILTALFGGAGFVMQRLSGQGVVFIHAGGMVSEFELRSGESMQVDVGSLVAFSPSVDFDIVAAGGIKSQLFGGNGVFLANMTGPGKVWIQSLPFSKLTQKFAQLLFPKKNK